MMRIIQYIEIKHLLENKSFQSKIKDIIGMIIL